ncbi:GNAT family N-acetyltransferase [Paenibacillus thailandensis]|uniref:GNAT family N-acetyltransferase n=1 Tax=Paenibacillus thailandensis TaxID=393250 RepID=A0ABW5QVM4_9BACL
MAKHGTIVSLLERDALTNLSLLKMLETFGSQIEAIHVSDAEDWGVLLLLPTEASPYDRTVYPGTAYVVFAAYTNASLFPRLAERLPRRERLVIKLQDNAYAADFGSVLAMERIRSFVSFTAPAGAEYGASEDVTTGTAYDEEQAELWMANGYERGELESYFKKGALSFSLRREGECVSTCLVFPNYKRIWEIGAVHTKESWRERGLAKITVEHALHHTLQSGLIPRYNVAESNTASIRLAGAVGLTPFMTLEHYLA